MTCLSLSKGINCSWSEAITPNTLFYVLCSKFCSCGRGACSRHFPLIFLSFSLNLPCVFLSSPFMFFPFSFHRPVMFLLVSFHLPSWFFHFPFISRPTFSWSTEMKPQPPKACSMFHVSSCIFLEGVQIPFISLYVAFIYLSCSFYYPSCSSHFPIMFLSFPFLFLPFQGPPLVDMKPRPQKPCSMYHIPSCVFVETGWYSSLKGITHFWPSKQYVV